LNSASFNAARLIGPAVAGAAIALIGTGWVFVINGLSFASPIIVLLMLRTMVVPESDPEDRRDEPTGALSRLREGVAYVRSRPDLVMVMVIMFGVGTFGMNFQMTMALMATEVYDRGPEEYGLLGSIMAIGTLSGALVAARRRVPRRRLIVGGAVLFGVLEVVAGLMPTYATFAVSLVPIGVASMTVLTAANAYIQTTVPQYVRGRVLALYIMILMGGTPAGAPVIGWVADLFGARWSLRGGGSVSSAGAVAAGRRLVCGGAVVRRCRWGPAPRSVVSSSPPRHGATHEGHARRGQPRTSRTMRTTPTRSASPPPLSPKRSRRR